MTVSEKQKIVAAARTLIFLLEDCDDEEFIDKVLACVNDCEPYGLDVRFL